MPIAPHPVIGPPSVVAAAIAALVALPVTTPYLAAAVGIGAGLGAGLTAWRCHRSTQRRLDGLRRQHAVRLAETVHDLRTPLATVIAALEMLQEGYASTREEVEEFTAQASIAARQASFLVGDVLDAAALDAGGLRLCLGEHLAKELLDDAVHVLGLTAHARGIDLRVHAGQEDVRVHTDPRRCLQVLCNLIGNAVKFSESGSRIDVTVEPAGDRARFTVADEGRGVPATLQARLFSPFGRAEDDATAATEGSGLGLHLCRSLVQRLGGSIGYRPRSPRGSVFWFELPRGRGNAPECFVACTTAQAR